MFSEIKLTFGTVCVSKLVDQSPVVVHKDGVRNWSVIIEEKRHKKTQD